VQIIISGASGFIGSSLAQGLSNLGFDITAISRNKTINLAQNTIHELILPLTQESLNCLLHEKKPDVFIHCVGSPSVFFSEENPYLDFKSTIDTTLEVLEALRHSSPKTLFVLISSAAIYGHNAPSLLSEQFYPKPISVYGYNKWMAEILVQQYANQYSLNTLIIRPFSIYGENLKKQVIYDICKKLIHIPIQLTLNGTGNESRDFLHIDDFILFVFKLIEKRKTGIINIGSGKATTINELANKISSILSPKTEITFTRNASSINPMSLVCDIGLMSQLELKQTIELDAGLARVCNSLIQNLVEKK